MFELFKKFYEKKPLILPFKSQIKSWEKANRRMKWGIRKIEFAKINMPEKLNEEDKKDGFLGSILCYGFGDDSAAHSDAVLSGKLPKRALDVDRKEFSF
jgi:hypothetical protein